MSSAGVTVTLPPGAVSTPTAITVTGASSLPDLDGSAPLLGFTVEARDAATGDPVSGFGATGSLSVSLGGLDLTGVDVANLAIARLTGGTWSVLPTSGDSSALSASLPGPGTYAVVEQAPATPAVVDVAQASDAPQTGLHRVDPGARVHITITLRPKTKLYHGRLVEGVPRGWRVADADGGTSDESAGTVAWTLTAIPAGSSGQRYLDLVAPQVPTVDGAYAIAASLSAQLEQGSDTASSPALELLVAPRVIVAHLVLSQLDGHSLEVTALEPDRPIPAEQRFEVFRIRFQIRNADDAAVSWTPQLEFRALPPSGPTAAGAGTASPAPTSTPGPTPPSSASPAPGPPPSPGSGAAGPTQPSPTAAASPASGSTSAPSASLAPSAVPSSEPSPATGVQTPTAGPTPSPGDTAAPSPGSSPSPAGSAAPGPGASATSAPSAAEIIAGADTVFASVPAGDVREGVPFYVTREWTKAAGGGTILGPESEPIAPRLLMSAARDRPEQGPTQGLHSMGANPLPTAVLPADSITEIEFSVRATVDAKYLSAYEFRLTDGGVELPGAVTAGVSMGPEPAPALSPVQYAGIPVAATEPLTKGVAYPLAAPAQSTADGSSSPDATPAPGDASAWYGLVAPSPSPSPRGSLPPPTASAMLGGMLTSSSPDEPHGPYTATTDACAVCHRAHSAQGANLLPARLPQSSLCFTCHDGSSAAPNVKAQYVTAPSPVPSNDPSTGSYYSHDALTPSNHTLADSNEWQDLHGAPIMNRHSECGDCHNAHKATADPAAAGPNGWSLPGALKGISGVVVTNSTTLGAAPTYQWTPGSSQTPISLEYQLCLKCHSGFTTLPAQIPGKPSAWELDKAIELNPANGSYHPIEGAGTNATTAMGQSLAGTSPYKLWTFSTSDTVRCVNCHGDPAKFDPKNPPLPGSDLAAHASQNRGLLGANYRDRLLKASLDAYAAGDFALCFSCHAEAPFTDTTGSVRDDTNFRYHGYHVANLQNAGSGGTDIDTAGAGQGNAICSECHFRIHGTALAVNAGDQWNSRLVNFAPDVIASGAAWTATGVGSGSCTLNCHGKPHTAALYDAVANPITLTVSASPVTYDAAGQAIAFTYVIGNSGAAPISGPFTVSDDHVGSPAVTPFACGSATSLDPGQTTTCTASYAITAADVSSGSVTGRSTATNGSLTSITAKVTVSGALRLATTAVPTSFVGAGDSITYAYVITNTRDIAVAGPFNVLDDHVGTPPGSAFACGSATSLDPGQATSCTATYKVTDADVTAGLVTSIAVATNGTVNSNSTSVTVSRAP